MLQVEASVRKLWLFTGQAASNKKKKKKKKTQKIYIRGSVVINLLGA